MSNVPSDPIDPAEREIARRVGAFSDQAVQPIDAGEIARAAAVAARGSGVRGARLGRGRAPRLAWVLVAGVLVVAAGGAVIGAGGLRGLTGPAPTTAPAQAAIGSCTPNDVNAVITAWDGAAGHRIATVELHQVGTTSCTMETLARPSLADGNGAQLILGKAGAGGAPIALAPGDVLHTLVQAGNYCGPDPVAPVTVAFIQGGVVFTATALTPTDLSGVPPCNGTAGPTDDIQMQPWSR